MDLHQAISRADLCELLTIAFRFPDTAFAKGICEGSFIDDLSSCLREIGIRDSEIRELEKKYETFNECDQEKLCSDLKKEYSRLYLSPGGKAEIFPYEGAFVYKLRGNTGNPSLFMSPTAIDVEKHMKNSGVIPKNARKEPVDSIFNEFEFMMYQYAQLGAALSNSNEDEQQEWEQKIAAFSSAHVQTWMPLFMQAAQEKTQLEAYRIVADTALLALKAL